MKVDFFNLIFSNKFRIYFDDPDAQAHDGILHICPQQADIMRCEVGESVMIYIGIVGALSSDKRH